MKAKKLMRDELRWLRKYRSLPSAKCRWQFRRLVEELIEVIIEEARRPEGPDDDGGIPAPTPKLTIVQTSATEQISSMSVRRRSTAAKHVAMNRHVPGRIAFELLRGPMRAAKGGA